MLCANLTVPWATQGLGYLGRSLLCLSVEQGHLSPVGPGLTPLGSTPSAPQGVRPPGSDWILLPAFLGLQFADHDHGTSQPS